MTNLYLTKTSKTKKSGQTTLGQWRRQFLFSLLISPKPDHTHFLPEQPMPLEHLSSSRLPFINFPRHVREGRLRAYHHCPPPPLLLPKSVPYPVCTKQATLQTSQETHHHPLTPLLFCPDTFYKNGGDSVCVGCSDRLDPELDLRVSSWCW